MARISRKKRLMVASIYCLAMGFLGFGAITLLHQRESDARTDHQAAPLPVTASLVSLADHYSVQQQFVGRIEAARQTELAFEQAGLITELLADEGDDVVAGQTLARQDTRFLEIERDGLLADIARIDADIELARLTTGRREKLKDRGFETGQSYDEARLGMSASIAQRSALLAQIARIDLRIEKSEIRAPFDGRVAARWSDDGTVSPAGSPVFRLQEITAPQARIGVPPALAARMSPGQEVSLSIDGLALKGELISISPELDPATRTVALLIGLEARDNTVIGEIAKLSTSSLRNANGSWVPLAALQEGTRGTWSLFVAVPETADGENITHTARKAAVEIIHVEGSNAFVHGTLKPDDIIVIEGSHRLSVGQAVIPEMVDG